jgi:3-phenylpropionate/trans-cinnamate dioxygenase ferredoxin component
VAEWVRVAGPDACEGEGCVHAVTAQGEAIVLARWNGEVFALEDRCSHQDFPLSDGEVENGRIECIFHGAQFDLRTGKAVRLPAIAPVRTFPVQLRDDGIFIEVEG